MASDATKAELSDAVDTMIEEVRLKEHIQLFTIEKGNQETLEELCNTTCV